jgi:hypothetical protein
MRGADDDGGGCCCLSDAINREAARTAPLPLLLLILLLRQVLGRSERTTADLPTRNMMTIGSERVRERESCEGANETKQEAQDFLEIVYRAMLHCIVVMLR